MEHVLEILGHAEVVLMKKIKAMKDGKPKYAASERLNEIRSAMHILRVHDDIDGMLGMKEESDEEYFTKFPPQAKA